MSSIRHDEKEMKFFTDYEGKEARLSYSVVNDRVLDFYSTNVPEEARGQGLARKLVEAGLAFAKDNNFKVKPSCSYVEVFFKKYPEYSDLIEV